MSDACREWRGELAATAAGRPDPDKQAGLLAHLDGCPHCREELTELRRVATTLAIVDADRLSDPPHPPASLAGDVATAVAIERRHRARAARWRNVLVGALAAAAAFALMLGIVSVAGHGTGSVGQHVAFATAPPGVEASADLTAAKWGTQIQLSVDGLDHDGDVYWLWLSTSDGKRVAAGTFSGDGTMHMTAALPLDQAARVWVTDRSDAVVLDAQLH
ncbi:MAG TPA: anti-sigma factor [Acidimicrobiales bacterium]|nr:anti-sigma factor [Acidimicrobiales bacterium]